MDKGRLTAEIDQAFDKEAPDTYRSSRIGASIIGNPCEAYLAFALRGFPDGHKPPKLKRIFRDGHRIENVVVADLRKAGFLVHDKDPMTGKQYLWDKHGYLPYYADGIIEFAAESALLEIKSMNDAMWQKFKKDGLRVSHRKYYHQLQMGMGLSKFHKAVLVAYNKDNSEYWDETVLFDEIEYYALLAKGEKVLKGYAEKVAKDPTDWRCKDCSKRDVCWKDAPVVQDIKSCANAYPGDGGKWECPCGCHVNGTCMNYERYRPKERT